MTVKEAFIAFRKAFIEAFKSNAEYQEAKASGNFERFVESESSYTITSIRFTQRGPSYTPYIDAGKPPEVARRESDLQERLYDWLRFRKYNLSYENDSKRKSIAYLMARKQKREGSYKYRNPAARTTFIADSIAKARPVLFENLGQAFETQYSSEVIEEIKKINKENPNNG